ncbi:MAG TPA: DUF3106 domain-containing protein [Bryobacteraceae bacterium]
MFVLRAFTVFVLAGILAFAGQGGKPKAEQAEPRPREPGAQGQDQGRRQNAQPKGNNHPGEQMLMNLSQMTPEEREKALSRLPPAQRTNIEKRIEKFQTLPPAQQERQLDRLQRLNALSPQRQQQVRRSMRDLQDLPQDRKKAINQEARRLSRMPEDDRQNYLNSDEFHNRFSPDEQKIVGDIAEITPLR